MNYFKKAFKGSKKRGSHPEEESSSRLSLRRHSISEMGSSDSDRSLRWDQGLHGCSSHFSINVDEVIEPSRRRTCSSTRAQEQAADPMHVDEEEDWEFTPEGFSLRTNIEETRHKCRRLAPNFDIDYNFMNELRFTPSIEKAFQNLGWSGFVQISAICQKEIALEILTTMDIVNSSDLNHTLRFRIKEEWVDITFNMIGSLLGFWKNCPENTKVNQEVLETFWLQIAEDSSKERMKIVNPILKIIHRFMTLRVLERLDDTKVQNTELKWLYVALRHPMRTNPIFSMINHWIT